MKACLTILALLAAGLSLAGCAQQAAERRSAPIAGESLASSVMRGAGFGGHRDAESARDSAMGALPLSAVTRGDLIDAGNIALTGLTGVVSAFAISSDRPEDVSQIVAWPPADYAPTAVEAQRRFFAEIGAAVAASSKIFSEPHNVEAVSGNRGGTFGEGIIIKFIREDCREMAFGRCQWSIARREDVLPEMTTGPSTLPGAPRWAFRYRNGAISFEPIAITDEFPPRRRALVDEMTFYEAISRNLPDWAFIYVAPFTAGYLPEGSDKPHFYPAPVVLNRGLAHYFVEGQTAGVPLIRSFGAPPT